MESNQAADGTLMPLTARNIDTGMQVLPFHETALSCGTLTGVSDKSTYAAV